MGDQNDSSNPYGEGRYQEQHSQSYMDIDATLGNFDPSSIQLEGDQWQQLFGNLPVDYIDTEGLPTNPTLSSLPSQSPHNYDNPRNPSPVAVRRSPRLQQYPQQGYEQQQQNQQQPPQQQRPLLREGWRNVLLYEFDDLTVPLRIIDQNMYLPNNVIIALQQELSRQNNLPLYQPVASPLHQPFMNNPNYQFQAPPGLPQYPIPQPQATYQPPSAPLTLPIALRPEAMNTSPRKLQGKPPAKKQHARPLKIQKFRSSEFYEPLAQRPAKWGTYDKDAQDALFRYTPHGELEPNSRFEVDQIIEYLWYHPLHPRDYAGQVVNLKNSKLVLWIQCVPADSSRRYASQDADKCRFRNCPDPKRTIRKGDFRVAFDEQYMLTGNKTDPFYCAGYCHLYCLEANLNFPQLCRTMNIRPDTREKLPEGKSKFAITRDHPTMEGVVLDFMETAVHWSETGSIRPENHYEQTLCYKLTVEHLKQQGSHAQTARESRQSSNDITIHKNNLPLYIELRNKHHENKKIQPKGPPASKKAAKKGKGKGMGKGKGNRVRDESSDEEEDDDDDDYDEDILDEDILEASPSPRMLKPAKRAKRKN